MRQTNQYETIYACTYAPYFVTSPIKTPSLKSLKHLTSCMNNSTGLFLDFYQIEDEV